MALDSKRLWRGAVVSTRGLRGFRDENDGCTLMLVSDPEKRTNIGRIDSRPFLGNFAGCLTLILCGRDDVMTPLAMHEELAAAIPGAHLDVIDECAHLSAMGRTELVAAAMRQWLVGIAR